MIAREHRFHGHHGLSRAYREGIVARSPLISIRASKNMRRQTYRAAVVASRKVHKSAVVRNRIRRRIYELVRLESPNFAEPYDIIVTVHSAEVATLPQPQLEVLLRNLLSKTHVPNKNSNLS